MSQDPETPITTAADVNARFRPEQSSSEIVLAAEVAGRPEHTPEIEDLLLCLDGESLTVTRTDGERIVLDRAELEAFLGTP
jgi:hypothetical protein